MFNKNYLQLDVPRETMDCFDEYFKLITKWNEKINIISNSTMQDFWRRHIIDSAQLLKYIKNKDISLIDVGSGGGFPGIVLSILGIKMVTLIEADERKAAFLLQVASLSSNKINIIKERVEEVKDINCDIIVARAFTKIDSILNLTKNIQVNDKYLLLKGKDWALELKEAQQIYNLKYNVYNSITSDDGKVLELTEWQQK